MAKTFEVEVTVPEGLKAGDTFTIEVEVPKTLKKRGDALWHSFFPVIVEMESSSAQEGN